MDGQVTGLDVLYALLTTLFVGLKITGYIDWSWWWVLAPLWVPVAVLLFLVAVMLMAWAVVAGAGK